MSADATLWSSEAWASAPDSALLERTRDGSAEAFGELWRRHLPAAYAVANRHRGRSAPEDVVAEAASRVLALIHDGRGPDENFRAYFLSAVRTVAIDQGRRELRLVPTEDDDLEDLAPAVDDPLAGLATDEEGLALVRAAFAELPERDQRILWHTTVEGAAPRTVAPALGMTANAVSVRAMRAREQLRANYLDARAARELAGADSEECRWTVTHLGAFVRGRLPKRQTERARAHVAGCPHAAALAADLRVIHDGFPALVVPLAVAAGLATPGFVSGALVAGLTSAGAVTGPASSAGSSGSPASSLAAGRADRAPDVVSQVAGRATGLAVALAVTAGLAGVLGVPGASLADSRLPAAQAPSSATDAPSPAAPLPTPVRIGAAARPGAVAGPSGAPTVPGLGGVRAVTGTPRPAATTERTPSGAQAGGASQTAAVEDSPRATEGSGPAGAPGDGAPTPVRPRPPVPTPTATPTAPVAGVDPPHPPSSHPPSSDPPPSDPPASNPPPAEPGPAAPTISVRLLREGDTARISVRVRTEVPAELTVRIGNLSGAGRLTVRNSSWDCAQASRAAVSCSGGRGSAVLDQWGTGGVAPLVVRVTDRAGRTWADTVSPT